MHNVIAKKYSTTFAHYTLVLHIKKMCSVIAFLFILSWLIIHTSQDTLIEQSLSLQSGKLIYCNKTANSLNSASCIIGWIFEHC